MHLTVKFSQHALLLICVSVVAGCQKQPEIIRYERPKLNLNSDRMLVGITFDKDEGLYFKLVGEESEIEANKEPFLDFLKSVDFNESRSPDWEVPENWEERPNSNDLRIGTFKLGENKNLELAVTRMPVLGESEEHLIANIDRWRKQMGLGKSSPETRSANLEDLEGATETFQVLSLTGKYTAGMSAPFAGGPFAGGPFASGMKDHPPIPESNGSKPTGSDPVEPITYEVPEHWIKTRLAMTPIAFLVEKDDQKATVSVSPMPKINTWKSTLPIWKSSMKSELTDEELLAKTGVIEIMGTEGKLVTIEQPEATEKREALIAAMVVKEDLSWFFKLKGDIEMVEAEKANFEAFLKSIKIK